jgi:thiamine biosynthesis lipoprotein
MRARAAGRTLLALRTLLPLRTLLALLAALALPAACAGPAGSAGPAPEVAVHAESRPAMSTLVSVTLVGAPVAEAPAAAAEVFAIFDRVEAVMSEWRDGSPLASLNAAAGSGRWTDLPGELCQVLRIGQDGARRTGGLFDPTWAALRGLWRFGDGERPAVPDAERLAARCRLVSWRALELEAAPGPAGGPGAHPPCRARLAETGMAVGLGGLAKGWAVDQAVEALRRRGLRDFVVQAGGDLYASGRRGDRPWRIGIRDPRGSPDAPFASLEVSDRAFSTSGDYEHFFLAGGIRYHHVIDPRSCRPATASRSASILAATAVQAEVLGKAVFILGGEAGLRLAEREGAEALLVTADAGVKATPGLGGRLRLERAPTP